MELGSQLDELSFIVLREEVPIRTWKVQIRGGEHWGKKRNFEWSDRESVVDLEALNGGFQLSILMGQIEIFRKCSDRGFVPGRLNGNFESGKIEWSSFCAESLRWMYWSF
jgi:hypothetical protein